MGRRARRRYGTTLAVVREVASDDPLERRHRSLASRARSTADRPADRLVVGNWTDPSLLAGEVFDTVLVDYVVGALDGFAPYFQDSFFARLRPHCRGRVYVVGLEPYAPASDEGGAIVWEIARLRDACILLAGDRCYREYPRAWVKERMGAAGFEVTSDQAFPIQLRRAVRERPARRLPAKAAAHRRRRAWRARRADRERRRARERLPVARRSRSTSARTT